MWKTLHELPLAESLSCTLGPHCDSLGPHLITGEDLPDDAWLACIDCGATLGRLTPQGIQTCAGPERIEPMANERPEPMDWKRVRQALVKPVLNGGSAADTTLPGQNIQTHHFRRDYKPSSATPSLIV